MFHPTLKKVVNEYGDRVNFVQLDLPLESHTHARGAAKAHLCAGEQHAASRMAEALVESDDLTEKGILATATNLGLDVDQLQKCIASEGTETKLAGVEGILRDSGMLQGLPTTFVGSVMIVGAQDEVALRDAFERAARGDDDRGIPAFAYLGIVGLLAGLIVFGGRARRASA
jgi:protein-disulfide isomerase